MKRSSGLAGMLALATLLGCSGDPPTTPSAEPAFGAPTPISVMTQNMYIGADLDAVIAALVGGGDPTLPLALAVAQLLGNDLGARIASMADNIARSRPQIIGLQEVSQITVELPSPPFPVPVAITQDFLQSLLAELQGRGLAYRVAATNTNFIVDLTAVFGVPIRLVDQEVLLVEGGVRISSASNGSFPCPLCVPLGLFTLHRGWVQADARIAGKPITVLSTHLESGADPATNQLRTAQAQFLAQALAGAVHPVILMGDLNDVPGSSMYQVMEQAGFADIWAARGSGAGLTCCHDPDLRAGGHTQRIDYILTRGGFENGNRELVGGVRVSLLDPPIDNGGPRWASDHAGLLAHLPPAR